MESSEVVKLTLASENQPSWLRLFARKAGMKALATVAMFCFGLLLYCVLTGRTDVGAAVVRAVEKVPDDLDKLAEPYKPAPNPEDDPYNKNMKKHRDLLGTNK